MIIFLNKERMLVFFVLNHLQGVLHDYPFEAAEVDRQLLMWQLHLLNYNLYLFDCDVLTHSG